MDYFLRVEKEGEAFEIRGDLCVNKIIINRDSGEGGSFDESKFYDAIDKFFRENF